MLFRKRNDERIAKILGREALTSTRIERREIELICVVVRLQNFETLSAKLSLRDLGELMNGFYGAVADAIMEAHGDVNRFSGPTVVSHFNVLHQVKEAQILVGAINAFQHAHKAFDAALEAKIGIGICRSRAIAGTFGSPHRTAHTAFGPGEICAHQLAKKNDSIRVCERFAGALSRPQLRDKPQTSLAPHWKIEA